MFVWVSNGHFFLLILHVWQVISLPNFTHLLPHFAKLFFSHRERLLFKWLYCTLHQVEHICFYSVQGLPDGCTVSSNGSPKSPERKRMNPCHTWIEQHLTREISSFFGRLLNTIPGSTSACLISSCQHRIRCNSVLCSHAVRLLFSSDMVLLPQVVHSWVFFPLPSSHYHHTKLSLTGLFLTGKYNIWAKLIILCKIPKINKQKCISVHGIMVVAKQEHHGSLFLI